MNDIQKLILQTFSGKMLIDAHIAINNPEVSIIIPTYNCLQYLPEAIKSVQKQLIASIEIIILDDSSTDNTWRYLLLAAQCDQRIKPMKLAKSGVAKARNLGLKIAKGQYIAFLDADDHWLPRKLIKQINFHKLNPETTLSFCNYIHYNQSNDNLGDCFSYWPSFKKQLKESSLKQYVKLNSSATSIIFAENVIGTSGVMLNTKALSKDIFFDDSLASAEDWDFWLQASLMGPIGYTSSIDLAYLMRAGSESSNVKLRLEYLIKIMKRYSVKVFFINPVAILHCLSRLLTGYAEYHRILIKEHKTSAFNLNTTIKPFLYHLMSFALSPSFRLLKAGLYDFKTFIFNLFAESVAKCK